MLNFTDGIANIGALPAARLRNGVPQQVVPANRASAIPAMYHWRVVANVPNATMAIGALAADYYSAIVPTLPGFVAIPNPGPAANFAATIAHANASPAARETAIVLAAARAAIADWWQIGPNEYVAAETVNGSTWTYEAARPAAANVQARAARFRLTTGHTDNAGDLTQDEAVALSFGQFSAAESDLAFAVYRMAQAAPVLAGVSYLETRHHYLSSRVAQVKGVENQVLNDSNAAVKTSWKARVDAMRDLVWHKACHPVATQVLTSFARDAVVPARLRAANLGSAAIRCPYIEDSIKRGRAYVRLVEVTTPSIATYGHRVGVPRLVAALRWAEALAVVGPVNGMAGAQYNSRREALAGELDPAVQRGEPIVAWVLGWYRAMMDATGGAGTQDTLVKAYSIRKLGVTNAGSLAAGAAEFRKGRTADRANAEKGDVAAITLTDAPVAAANANPVANANAN